MEQLRIAMEEASVWYTPRAVLATLAAAAQLAVARLDMDEDAAETQEMAASLRSLVERLGREEN